MIDIHLTRELLQAVTRGELHPSVLTTTLLEHLMALCPTCHEEIEAWRSESSSTGSACRTDSFEKAQAMRTAVERSASQVGRQEVDLRVERREAKKDFNTLMRLVPESRLDRIRGAYKRFRSPFLAERLLDRSRSYLPNEPAQAFHFAELAHVVAQWGRDRIIAHEMQTLALANMANARRALGEIRTADALFRQARSVVRMEGVTEKLVYAELDWREGTLRRDQRRFDEAETLLERSVLHYRLAGDRGASVASVLLSLGEVYREIGELQKALASIDDALQCIDPEQEDRLFLMACHNRALCFYHLDRYEDARVALEENHSLYARFPDRWTQLRALWLEGKVLRGLGETQTAERTLESARDGFLEGGRPFDASQVALDLALVYSDMGRAAELQSLSDDLVTVFQGQELHREAMVALVLFRQAVRDNSLTRAIVDQLHRCLSRAPEDREASLQEPS
ncbi:MAG: tetratricopeptide repeat protein [Acidobacteriota bacterium]